MPFQQSAAASQVPVTAIAGLTQHHDSVSILHRHANGRPAGGNIPTQRDPPRFALKEVQ
jgi:hypothetical protein